MSDIFIPARSSFLHHVFPVLLLLFVGYIGFSLSIPIFPAILLDSSFEFVDRDYSTELRTIYLGCLLAVYPLGQAIGSPLLGKFSDRFGRKRVVLITLAGIIPAHLLTGWAIEISSLSSLLLIRFICGLLEGNIVIGQAIIADVSREKHIRAQNFGWVTAVVSGAFIFGPVLGGILSNNAYSPYFTFATPFYTAGLLAFISFIILSLLLKETKERNPHVEIMPHTIFFSMVNEFRERTRGPLYLHNFIVYTGQFFFWSFLNVYLMKRFSFDIMQMAIANGYSSLPMLFGPFIYRRIAHRFTTENTLITASLFVGISIAVFLLPSNPYSFLYTLLPIGFFIAMQYAFAALLISEHSSVETQGYNLGINQSGLVLAEGISGIAGGIVASYNYFSPIILASLLSFASAAYMSVYMSISKRIPRK